MDQKSVFKELTNFWEVQSSVRDNPSSPNPMSYSKGIASKGAAVVQLSPVSLQKSTLQESPSVKPKKQHIELRDRRAMTRSVTEETILDSKTMRSKRYTKAERELSDTIARCRQEKTLQELQVASLKKVISILSTNIMESKERLGQLHTLLTDRSIEPVLYREMQCERWMEERRHLSVVEITKVLEERLAAVASSAPISHPPEASSRSAALASRANSNLAKFLESPRRRVPTRNRTRRRMYVGSRSQDVLSLLPSTSALQTESNPTISTTLSPPTTPQASPSLLQSAAVINSAQQLAPVDENVGCITIWRDSPRSKEDILANLVVNMPEYVDDLLSGLDSSTYTPTPLSVPQEIQTPRPTYTPTSLSVQQEMQTPRSTYSRTSFVPDTPRSERSSLQVHKSPSRKRISTLFSLPEALSSRKTVNMESERSKHLSTPPAPAATTSTENTPRPFSVSFSGLPSSDSGGSQGLAADHKTPSRLRHRLSFFKRR